MPAVPTTDDRQTDRRQAAEREPDPGADVKVPLQVVGTAPNASGMRLGPKQNPTPGKEATGPGAGVGSFWEKIQGH